MYARLGEFRTVAVCLRATCCVARITMLHWDGKLLAKIKQNNLRLDEGARYMDDVRAILAGIREGWRWTDDGLYFCKEWEAEDRLLEETPTQRSARILQGIMNSILSFLKLTMEIGDDFDDKKLPTLDLKIWIQPGGRMIIYEHYEKPMKSNLVVQRKSALSENVKVASLTQEVVRVLLNCSEDLEDKSRVDHLNNLSVKMRTSGYNTEFIRKVMVAGIKTYEKKLKKSNLDRNHKNYAPLHLSKSFNSSQRRENKLMAKSNWYRQGQNVQDPN